MPTYTVTQRHYFRENGQTLLPGQVIDLTEAQAAAHNHDEPGLLVPERPSTQATPAENGLIAPAEAPKRGRRPKK